MNPIRFSFCFFPSFIVIFILLSSNNNSNHETIHLVIKIYIFNRGYKLYANDPVDQFSNHRISFHIYQKIIAHAIQWTKWLKKLSVSITCFTSKRSSPNWQNAPRNTARQSTCPSQMLPPRIGQSMKDNTSCFVERRWGLLVTSEWSKHSIFPN